MLQLPVSGVICNGRLVATARRDGTRLLILLALPNWHVTETIQYDTEIQAEQDLAFLFDKIKKF